MSFGRMVAGAVLLLAAVAAPAQQRAKGRVVVCFGDSLTAGYGAPQGASYPDFLHADLIAHGLYPTVVNAGVTGDTTKGGLSRVAGVVAQHPDVVVLELGGNDGLRGIPLATVEAQLADTITRLKAAHTQVLLVAMTLPSNYGADYIGKFSAMYPALARRFHLTLVPLPVKDVFSVPERMTGDGVHPNAAGYAVMAQAFLPYVTAALKR